MNTSKVWCKPMKQQFTLRGFSLISHGDKRYRKTTPTIESSHLQSYEAQEKQSPTSVTYPKSV